MKQQEIPCDFESQGISSRFVLGDKLGGQNRGHDEQRGVPAGAMEEEDACPEEENDGGGADHGYGGPGSVFLQNHGEKSEEEFAAVQSGDRQEVEEAEKRITKEKEDVPFPRTGADAEE